MTLYAMDHDEIFPPDLQTLSKEMKLAPSLFICPGTAHKAGSLSNLNEWTDYHYISGLNTENNTHSFIIFGHPSNHMGKGANVLFTDFHVKWFPAKRFAFFMNTPPSFFGSNSDSH